MKSFNNRAFTLIELLVVIAIISILAAILFPVFAQAKAAAKTSVAISNMKQAGLSVIMYAADSDDDIPITTEATDPTTLLQPTWKSITQPYVKSYGLYQDPMNPAAKYYDAQSDPALAAFYGGFQAPPVGQRFVRGYAMLNYFYLSGGWSETAYATTTPQSPANQILLFEDKMWYVEYGPGFGWAFDVPEPNGPSLGLGWNWSGGKWQDKAMVITFFDGHSKRITPHATCGRDTEINMWGYQRDQLNVPGAYIPGATLPWLDSYCQTIPPGF